MNAFLLFIFAPRFLIRQSSGARVETSLNAASASIYSTAMLWCLIVKFGYPARSFGPPLVIPCNFVPLSYGDDATFALGDPRSPPYVSVVDG